MTDPQPPSATPVPTKPPVSTKPSLDILGVDADAITALSAALTGVEALSAVVTLMEQAASGIITATETAKTDISSYVDTDLQEAISTKFSGAMPDLIHEHRERISNELVNFWAGLSDPPCGKC